MKRSIVMVLLAAVALCGCALIEKMQAASTEKMLSAAGFQMKLADTPEKLAHLQTLTQRKLVPHQRNGKVYYVYADALKCQCMYVGTEQAYQQYRKIELEKQMAEERLETAEMNRDAAMNWGMWGPYPPGWY